YCSGESASLEAKGEHVLLYFLSQQEPEGWEEGEGWLSSLIPLRDDILAGDLRSLYLGWLLCVQAGDLEGDDTEPPVPPGLGDLSGSLKGLADFLRIDTDLVDVAAERSPGRGQVGPTRKELAAWISALPDSEKDALLLQVAADDARHLRRELLHRFREANKDTERSGAEDRDAQGRSVAQLLAAAEARAEEKRRCQAEREARQRERRAREEAAARAKYLDELAPREAEVWSEVEELVASRLPKNYDRAAQLLKDLRDLAARSERSEESQARIRELRKRHAKKRTLLQRLDKAGLR
ncbi:MAG: hypothetical protein ACYTKD_19930, partial [Planctomycetota bacterium]